MARPSKGAWTDGWSEFAEGEVRACHYPALHHVLDFPEWETAWGQTALGKSHGLVRSGEESGNSEVLIRREVTPHPRFPLDLFSPYPLPFLPAPPPE